jgi:hypothetical protein
VSEEAAFLQDARQGEERISQRLRGFMQVCALFCAPGLGIALGLALWFGVERQ